MDKNETEGKKPSLSLGIYFKKTLDPHIDESQVKWHTHDGKNVDESYCRYYWYKDDDDICYQITDIGEGKRAVVQRINMKVIGAKDE